MGFGEVPLNFVRKRWHANCLLKQGNQWTRRRNLLRLFSEKKMDIEKSKEKIKNIAPGLKRKNILTVELFGSLERGDFHLRRDIDILDITRRELTLKEENELYFAFSKIIPETKKDLTVLVYNIESLKRIPTWQSLNRVKNAHFIYDKAHLEKVFQKIPKEMGKYGIFDDALGKNFRYKK